MQTPSAPGMSAVSAQHRLSRCFWPAVCVIFFCTYIICNTYNVRSSSRSKRLKHQPGDVINVTSASHITEIKGHLSNLSSGFSEVWHENIVYPQVDISDFKPVDQTICPAMCQDIEIAPVNSMPLIALASFPRSGNTWSRSLIQIATKYYTGSVHWETERNLQRVQEWFKAGVEDYKLRRGVCVKTHNFGQSHVNIFEEGAILLLRNPYYSLASEFIRYNSVLRNETKERIVEMMKTNDENWTKKFLAQYEKWKFTALSWIKNCKRLMIVFYEDLESNPVRELTRMVSFLGQPINPDRIQCAVHSFSPMKGRLNHTSQMTFDPYSPKLHNILDGYISEINQTLIRKNATPLPTYENYFHPT
ncbi:putative WSC domain-containing protein 2 [Apostichopus japonicus]|uniref:Putative WSC domain-containing protein 2 n=1 Tax=Stichopus japonicus TaxID=307972 RepID=A0A2G8L1S9_STIJA|nr:putative WSC domain-containing protein 2 [Apostichopus japonicus]